MLSAGQPLATVLQKLETSLASWMRCKKKYGGMKSEEAKRLRHLETENQQLMEMLAEAELDKRILKEAFEGNY